LGAKSGDQQARAELLGKLLLAAGEKPYILRHGTGRKTYHLIMLRVVEDELEQVAALDGGRPTVVRMGPYRFIPLSLEAGGKIGGIVDRVYNTDESRWTGSVALMPYR